MQKNRACNPGEKNSMQIKYNINKSSAIMAHIQNIVKHQIRLKSTSGTLEITMEGNWITGNVFWGGNTEKEYMPCDKSKQPFGIKDNFE